MPKNGTNWFDILLFAGLAVLLGGFVIVSAVEGWRHWSYNRRIRKHLPLRIVPFLQRRFGRAAV
jgi:hypothetical protein